MRQAMFLVSLAGLCVIGGCTRGTTASRADIQASPANVFILGAASPMGLARNSEVDGVLFRYQAPKQPEDLFWSELERQTREGGWKELGTRSSNGARVYQRARGTEAKKSFERAQVARCHGGRAVIVGYVHADAPGDKLILEDTDQAPLVEKWWERFDQAVAECGK
ncbi:MAG: hypothetical protein ACT4QC_03895 [Planctomycetaceae bacterium]